MKAVKIITPNQAEISHFEVPELKAAEILINVMSCGICGTDIHILRGQYLGNYPVIPGHELSGVIAAVGRDVTRFKPGDRVAIEPNISCDNCHHCLQNRQNFCENWQAIGVTLPGGMAQQVVAPEKVAFHIGDLPFAQGAMMEPLSCILYGLERVPIKISDRVAVLGAGPIGLLFLQTVRLQGAVHVTIVEKQNTRAELAAELGANQIINDLNKVKENEFDVVIDATGVKTCMERTIDLARPGGRILLFGVPAPGEEMQLDSFKIFQKGLSLSSSYTSVRNSFQAVGLLQSGMLATENLISHTLPLADFVKGVEIIEKGADNVRKVMILPQE